MGYTGLKVKSISDVITNSSTEVFVVTKKDKQYCENTYFSGLNTPNSVYWNPEEITWKWLKNRGKHEWMMVMDVLGKSYTEVSVSGEEPSQNRWNIWMEENRYEIQKKLMGLWWLNVEDKFSGFLEMAEELDKRGIKWFENRH